MSRKLIYLHDFLEGEPMSAIRGFPDNWSGYVLSLKTLKFMFGQRTNIAQATLGKVIRCKQIQDEDDAGLNEFFYTVNECIVTLRQLNYASDINSSDTLRQAAGKLPIHLQRKWAEQCWKIRKSDEPNMLHFQSWLRDCVLARKEACWPSQQRKKTPAPPGGRDLTRMSASTFSEKPGDCPLCKGDHYLGRCESYTTLPDTEKLQTVQRLKVCYNCVKPGHILPDCPSKATCREKGCEGKHHTSIHKVYKEFEEQSKQKPKDCSLVSLLKSPKEVFLLVVPVVIHPRKGEPVHTFAFLDNCSQSTLLREDMARSLDLFGEPDVLNMGTIKDKPEGIPVEFLSLEISSTDGTYRTTIEEVSVVPIARLNMPGRPRLSDVTDPDMYTHLDDIDLNAIRPESITMLIGANVPEAVLTTLDVRCGGNNQPLAVKTLFGWTLFGPAVTSTHARPSNTSNVSCLFTRRPPAQCISSTVASLWEDRKPPTSHGSDHLSVAERGNEKLCELVQSFWDQEVGPIAPGNDVALSREDVVAEKTLDDATVLVNGHYQVPMLWKNVNSQLPNNKEMALKRFGHLRRRLRKDPTLYQKYKETFDRYLQKGYARRMTESEASCTTSRTWYLPHHPVTQPSKPGKVRVVKDAAAQYQGVGLNASLKSGPDLLNSLIGALLRLRSRRIAIIADVEEMFYQVAVNTKDADSLRFIWTDDIFSDNVYTMQMLVHVFGARSSPTCANYALQRTARDNQRNFNP